jgi:hypothetical protein
LQLPGSYKEEEEAGGAWTIKDSAPALLEDFEGIKFVLVAETADAEAMEPCMLAEAKRRPDWLLWEKAIEEELSMLKAAGTWRLEEALPGANIIGSKCVTLRWALWLDLSSDLDVVGEGNEWLDL